MLGVLGVLGVERWVACGPRVVPTRLRGRSRFLTYGQNCFGVAKARSGFAGWRTRWTYTPSGSARPLRVRRPRGPLIFFEVFEVNAGYPENSGWGCEPQRPGVSSRHREIRPRLTFCQPSGLPHSTLAIRHSHFPERLDSVAPNKTSTDSFWRNETPTMCPEQAWNCLADVVFSSG